MLRYSAKDLRAMPTLAVGQADDLKVDDGEVRVWLSRCGPEDGEPYRNKVSVESLLPPGRWIVTHTYRG